MGQSSTSGQKLTTSNQGYWRLEDVNGYQILFDGTVHRIIIGILPDGTVGMVISKEGNEVLDQFS